MSKVLALMLAAVVWAGRPADPPAFAIPGSFKGGFRETQKLPGGEETLEVTGTGLVWTRLPNAAMKDFAGDPESAAPSPKHDADPPAYRLTAGSITVRISGHTSANDTTCTVEGEQTYSVASLSGALNDFKLVVYPDKTYTLMMWMHSRAFSVTATHTCQRFRDTLKFTHVEDGLTVVVGQRQRKPMDVRSGDSVVIAGTSNIPLPFTAAQGSWNFVGSASR